MKRIHQLGFVAAGLLLFAIDSECLAWQPDAGDIKSLVNFALLFAAIISALICGAIGASMADDKRIGATFGAITGAALVGLSVAWPDDKAQRLEDERNKLRERQRAERERTTQISVSSLEAACSDDERFVIRRKIPPGSSVFLNLPSKQLPPSAAQAPPVVQTDEMKEQVRRLGDSFPPSNNQWQYEYPIVWMKMARNSNRIAELVGSDLVEWEDDSHYYQKPFVRLATKERWIRDGLQEIPEERTRNYIYEHRFANWKGLKSAIPIGVDRAIADYVFTVEDISTVEDRARWLGRGRIRLSDAKTNAVLAEYTGFQAILNGKICPKAAKFSVANTFEWDLVTFFFSEVVQSGEANPQ